MADHMGESVNLHRHGVKEKKGKLRLEMVPPELEEAVAKVMEFGLEKYIEDGWKTVPDAYREYFGAIKRHMNKLAKGIVIDEESGLPHIYHIACNAAFLVWFHAQGIACRPFEPK